MRREAREADVDEFAGDLAGLDGESGTGAHVIRGYVHAGMGGYGIHVDLAADFTAAMGGDPHSTRRGGYLASHRDVAATMVAGTGAQDRAGIVDGDAAGMAAVGDDGDVVQGVYAGDADATAAHGRDTDTACGSRDQGCGMDAGAETGVVDPDVAGDCRHFTVDRDVPGVCTAGADVHVVVRGHRRDTDASSA